MSTSLARSSTDSPRLAFRALRCGALTLHRIQEVLDGDLGEIVNSLVAHSQAEKLKVARPGAA